MAQFLLIVWLCLLALQPLILHALDVHQLKDHNCSAALNIPIQRRHHTMGTEAAPGESAECPPWFHRDSQGAGCEAGPQLGGIVWQNMETLQTYLMECNCMTQSNGTLAVGACLYACNVLTGYFPLSCDVTDLNNFTCAGLNREGQLCGQCIEDHAPPVYSYDLRCVECKDYQYNWLKYLAVAFLPLTVFFCVVTVFSISFTSPLLSGVVLMYQILAPSVQMSIFILLVESGYFIVGKHPLVFLASVAGVWNLDFFRLAYDPFCLHPNMTTLQVLALDYVIVLYPLLLIVLTYVMVNLHDRHFKPVVWVWKPFRWLLKRFKQQWNVRTSLIDVLPHSSSCPPPTLSQPPQASWYLPMYISPTMNLPHTLLRSTTSSGLLQWSTLVESTCPLHCWLSPYCCYWWCYQCCCSFSTLFAASNAY